MTLLLTPLVVAQAFPPTPGPNATAPPFDAAQYARFAKRGTGRIDGVFSLRVGSGPARTPSGASVECLPDLPYTEWALAQTANTINGSSDTSQSGTPNSDDPRLRPYTRITKTDTNGNFHFYRLPYGRYVMRVSFISPFPRTVHNQVQAQLGTIYDAPQAVGTGITVFDYTHAYFDSVPVYVGSRPPLAPVFRLVARHNTFDPRR